MGRRFVLAVLVFGCAVVCGSSAGASPAVAATQFGSNGSEAGQFENPKGVAVDASGDVYVGDAQNHRVDKFDGSGGFLLAWGEGVYDKARELETCTLLCGSGRNSDSGSAVGGFEFPTGVAVDNELSSLSYGDVYVVDIGKARVEKYDSSGKFLLMFGGHVNETTGGDVCVAGEACKVFGTEGTEDGEFSAWFEGSFIGVGPGGAVYVGDQARVQVFEPSGAWRENISLAGLSATGRPSALAVDAAGDVFVKDREAPGVRELEPGGVEKPVIFDEGSETVSSLALDPSGNVYVGDSNGGFHVLEYDSAGKELASFASNTVVGYNGGMAFSTTTKELYASQYICVGFSAGVCSSSIWVLTPPPPGPVVAGESATSGLRGTATLEAAVNPEGNDTTYHFEYVDEAHYQTSGFASATSTASVTIEAGLFEDHAVTAELTKLVPGGTYHYRVVATDTANRTTDGPDQSLTTIPPAYIDGPWASNAASTSVTLAARIDPLGANTTYRLEYGTSASYGHVLSGNVGEGMSFVQIAYHLQELEPATTYHYRLVTESEVGTVEGADHAFTTQIVGGELTLPDGRAWELVSPADKKGALIEPFYQSSLIQVASDGSGIVYLTHGPHVGVDAASKNGYSTVLSRRGAGGWGSEDISLPDRQTTAGISTQAEGLFGSSSYPLFSPDLSLAVVEPAFYTTPPLSPDATERTLYLRDGAKGTFLPLVTPANVPAGTEFGGGLLGRHGETEPRTYMDMHFVAGTPDLSHVVLESPLVLAPPAVFVLLKGCSASEETDYICGLPNLYEWSGGRLQLVNILPDGEPTRGHPGVVLAGGENEVGNTVGTVTRAISADGRWIAWKAGSVKREYDADNLPVEAYQGFYVRDMVAGRTVQVAGRYSRYETMSSDGSMIFYREGGDLYEFDTATGAHTDLTGNHGAGERDAGVKEAVIGTSEDGSYVYFAASGVLAEGAVSGEDNVYVLHHGPGGWSTRLVATLSGEDEKSWYGEQGGLLSRALVDSRVTPSGRYLAFMSNRSLTGYDNTDAFSGVPDQEVYVYDANTGRLVCASCNPTGARPVGVLDPESPFSLLVDRSGSLRTVVNSGEPKWLAGNVPGWDQQGSDEFYQPRYLLDNGRLFFNSPDALVPQDTNGLEDVYEYEPVGVGDCTSASATFSARSAGCVNLISSGQSAQESAFYDASESGDDAFFVTASKLASEDYDTSYDVYDAHVCSASVPCRVVPVSPPACTSGDSCKAAPSPQPEIFGPAPSATFSGTGNVVEEPKRVVKRKVKPKKHAKRRKRRRGRKAGRDKGAGRGRKASGVGRASGRGGR